MVSTPVKKIVVRLLKELADKIEEGNTNISVEEAAGIMEVISHIGLCKDEACRYLNLRRDQFDKMIRDGKLPRGRKLVGRKEHIWYKDELNRYLYSK